MSRIINHTVISSKPFTFTKKTNCLVAEISDLPKVDLQTQIYDDACDAGFTMLSEKTGKEVVFSFDDVDYNGFGEDREIAGWRFNIIPECVKKMPHLAGLSVLIIND